MQILFDNLDGLGFIDYTSCVQFGPKMLIIRTLNAPSACQLSMIACENLPVPRQSARLKIQSTTYVYLFTGFVISSLETVCLGAAAACFVREIIIYAVSDEVQLDAAAWETGTTSLGGTATENWQMLSFLAAQGGLQLRLADGLTAASRVIFPAGGTWSQIAGRLAANTRSSYRALNNVIEVSPVGTSIHLIPACDSQLVFLPSSTDSRRRLANDITLFGHIEADAYITEIFEGDGSTSDFTLSALPFRPLASQTLQLADQFQGTTLSPQLWVSSDPGGHIGLTEKGLTCAGGSGRPGESFIMSIQTVELGGNLQFELSGVQVEIGSQGIIAGLFTADPSINSCLAGFNVSTQGSITTIASIVNGSVSGSAVTISATSVYTLRIQISAPTWERVSQSYSYQGSSGPATMGGSTAASSGRVILDLQDVTGGVLSNLNTLYEGVIPSLPASCHLSPLVSGSLVCSIQAIHCKQTTPLQISSMAPGAALTQLKAAPLSEGGSCRFENTGTLNFYPATTPANGTILLVKYRSAKRAVARSFSTLASTRTMTATSYIGYILHPPAWSSLDCESAAQALLSYSSNGSAAAIGTYRTLRRFSDDFWPGDILADESALQTGLSATIQRISISLVDTSNDLLEYDISFSNEQADLSCIALTDALPEAGSVPQQATNIDHALPSLSALQISNANSKSLSIDAGIDAPLNGGFEVRRRDYTFGPQDDSDLALRASGRYFSIPRASAIEQFFVRMYNGSNPALYSAISAAIYVNPLS